MTYLEIIKELEKDFSERLNEKSLPNNSCQRSSTDGPQTVTEYEKYEINEKTRPASSTVPAKPDAATPLGAKNGFLTIEDMPQLQRRLELSGWKVERRGDELICWSATRRKPKTQ